jgi:hypothetical protein
MKPRNRNRLPHSAITKAAGLLPMMYSTNELCVELDVPRDFIESWLQAGLPYQRDRRQHIWINGEECTIWIETNRKAQKRKKTLKANQAYCFRCQKAITVVNPQFVTHQGNRRLTGRCPDCTGSVNKGVSNDRPEELQNDTRVSSVQKRDQSTL